MIFINLDLCESNLEEFLKNLEEVRKVGFDGVEISIWENMLPHAKKIRERLRETGLNSIVHADLLRKKEGMNKCKERLDYSIGLAHELDARHVTAHPIKPYKDNLELSKKTYGGKDICIETMNELTVKQTIDFGLPIILDTGNLNSYERKNIENLRNIRWVHAHDISKGEDHYPIGEGEIDWKTLIDKIKDYGLTIEMGNKFRRWKELKEDYIKSINFLKNKL